MTAIQTQPVRLDRLQQGLFLTIQDGLGSAATTQVAWAYGEGVYDATFPGCFVNLTLTSGPNYVNRSGARGTILLPPTLLTFTIDSVTVGQRYAIALNHFQYAYDAILGDDQDDVRDALVALIVADTESPYSSAATVTLGEFSVTPDFNGAIWQAAINAGDITGTPTLSDNAVLVTSGQRACMISIGCFSKSSSIRGGAWSICSKIQAILESTEAMELLNTYGVGCGTKSPVTNLSAVDNGRWESRVSFDDEFTIMSTNTTPVDQIETAVLNLRGLDPDLAVSFTVSKP